MAEPIIVDDKWIETYYETEAHEKLKGKKKVFNTPSVQTQELVDLLHMETTSHTFQEKYLHIQNMEQIHQRNDQKYAVTNVVSQNGDVVTLALKQMHLSKLYVNIMDRILIKTRLDSTKTASMLRAKGQIV